MRNYYFPYNPGKYKSLYLLALYAVAEYNKTTRRYDTIQYKSLQQLTDTINQRAGATILSKATLSRYLNGDNAAYFTHDKGKKTITLHNNYSVAAFNAGGRQPFVILTDKEVSFLLANNDSLCLLYFLYLKYTIGKAKGQEIDNTRGQFLTSCGLPATSGDYLARVSSCNTLLENAGFLIISRHRDEAGRLRNGYRLRAG